VILKEMAKAAIRHGARKDLMVPQQFCAMMTSVTVYDVHIVLYTIYP
jgi:hypothetical protein